MRSADQVRTRRRPRRRLRAHATVGALIAVGVLVAGCGGGGSNPGVANVSTSKASSSRSSSSSSSTANAGGGGTALGGDGPSSGSGGNGSAGPTFALRTANPQGALEFSECMRAHGVTNFPDPNGQGVIEGKGIDPNSPSWQRASKSCVKDLGRVAPSPAQTAQNEAGALAFSKCMRSHGVANFPDPQFGSGGAVRISIGAEHGSGGVDPSSPVYQTAQKTCGSLLPGLAGKTAPP